MFARLFGSLLQPRHSAHPLASEEKLAALIAGISSGAPARQLLEVDGWLAGMEDVVSQLGHAAALQATCALDECSRAALAALLSSYLAPGTREHLAEPAWAALDGHAMRLFAAYRLLLDDVTDSAGHAKLAARAVRAWALRKKLLRMRYQAPLEAFWQSVHELMRQVERAGLGQTAVVAYAGEPATTPLREYLIGVYFELAPIGNLVPAQLEFLDRFLGTRDSFEFSVEADATSTHAIDLTQPQGPRRIRGGPSASGELHFLAAARLREAVLQVALALSQSAPPQWLQGLPLAADKLQGVVGALAMHWASAPPQRRAERVDQREDLLVVFGFEMARRMVDAASGRAPDSLTGDRDPLATLCQRELSNGRVVMEQWRQVDVSSQGMGASVPAVLSHHCLGVLVAVRYRDGLEWRLGLIRRIGEDAAHQPLVGVELLAGPSLCATARPTGLASRWTGPEGGDHGEVDALVLAAERSQVILPAQAFIEGIEVGLRSEEDMFRVRLVKLLDRGPDYDYVEFETLQK